MKRAVVLVLGIALLLPALSLGTHPRPISAPAVSNSLVPAYEQCVAPDRLHGPPLAYGSCSNPQQTSDYLTVGTFDANGQPAQSVGKFRVESHPYVNPLPPPDNKISFYVSITDVRCKGIGGGCPGPGADYTGGIEARIPMQISDHYNGTESGSWPDPGTVQPITFTFPISCTATPDDPVGSTCRRDIGYIEEILFSGIPDAKRGVWEFGPLQLWDGGADGDGTTAGDNTLFAVQGLFVP